MILSDYLRFEKLPNQKSKLRIDCTASTGSYDPLEVLRNKADNLFLYLSLIDISAPTRPKAIS